MLLISRWMPTVGRLLSQGEMSHSYCTEILKYFSFHSVSGQEDKFDPKRRKTRHILAKGTMFSRLVTAFSKGNLIEIKLYYLPPLFYRSTLHFQFLTILYIQQHVVLPYVCFLWKMPTVQLTATLGTILSKYSHGIWGHWTSVPTWGLIVQRNHLAASVPENLRHVITGIDSASLGVNATHLPFVITV